MRVTPSTTTASATTIPMPVAASPAGITFQATLANSSAQANTERASAAGGLKAPSRASGAGRAAAKHDRKHGDAQSTSGARNDSALVNAPVPPAEDKTAAPQGAPGGQANSDDAGDWTSQSATPITVGDSQFLNASVDLSQQVAAQVISGTTGALPPVISAATEAPPQPSPVKASDNAKADANETVQADAGKVDKAIQDRTGGVAQVAAETFKLLIELPSAAPSSSNSDSLEAVGKTGSKNAPDAAGSKNSELTKTKDTEKPDSVKAKPADAVGAAPGAASHSAQSNNGQSMQHAQPDDSQVTAVVQKIVDGGAAQAVPMHAAVHVAASNPGTASGLQAGTHPGDRADMASSPLDGDEATLASGINAAKLIQTLSDTEMRVGMHSAEFGNISIRTTVSQQQMLAQISLDHGALSQAISGHISSMQTKLGNDYGLQTLIQVNHQGASTSGEQGSSPQREQRAFASSGRTANVAISAELDVGMSSGMLANADDGYRLDIRA